MYEHKLEIALHAVRQACRLCANVRASLITDETITKKDKSPVTIADLGAQAVMSHRLHEAFGDIPLVAEEDTHLLRDDDGNRGKVVAQVRAVMPEIDEKHILAAIDRGHHAGGGSGRFWTLDPIDGTKGYIRGDQYAVALALIVDGRLQLGILGCPNLPVRNLRDSQRGVLFWAVRDNGARAQPLAGGEAAPMYVSPIDDATQAVVCESVEASHTSHSLSARIAARLGIAVPPVGIDSQCKYGVVARGEAGIYMRLPSRGSTYAECIWDHAAGAILVEEAGGRVSDITGAPLDFTAGRKLSHNRGVIATNGKLHDRVVEAVQAELPRD